MLVRGARQASGVKFELLACVPPVRDRHSEIRVEMAAITLLPGLLTVAAPIGKRGVAALDHHL